MKTEPNDSVQPQIESKETFGETLWIDTYSTGGLTKREYFAGQAMASYFGGEYIGQSGMPYEAIATNCVLMADALILALNA